jgi:hypothetical protein
MRFAPWAGFVLGATAWAVNHQVTTDALHFDCTGGDGSLGIAFGIGGLALTLAGGAWSWRARGRCDRTRRFIATASAVGALGLCVGIGLQLAAALLVHGCAT